MPPLSQQSLRPISWAVDGGQIAYDDTGGNGPLILAIPGMGDLRSEYRLLRPGLLQAGCRVVTMDVRGAGQTSAQWNDYSAHAVGRDALALLDQLNAGPAIILGNSFAAGSALWAANDDPGARERCGAVGSHRARPETVPIAKPCAEVWLCGTVAGLVLDHLLGQSIHDPQARRSCSGQSCNREKPITKPDEW